jgi:tetratricopeptide (TPR) repeat protein
VVSDYPDSAGAYLNLGAAHLILGEWDNVEEVKSVLKKLNPTLAVEFQKQIDRTQGQARRELFYYTSFARRRPKDAMAQFNLGSRYLYLRDFNAAIRSFRKAVQLRPNFAVAYRALGKACLTEKRFEDAASSLQLAIEHTEHNAFELAEIHIELGLAYLYLFHTQSAMEAFRAALRYSAELSAPHPDEAFAHYGLGVCLIRFSQEVELKTLGNPMYYRLDAIAPSSDPFMKSPKEKRSAEILFHLKEAVRLRADFSNAYLALGRVYIESGETGLALSAYQTALRLRPDDADLHLNMAALQEAQGYYEIAIGSANTALKLRPIFPDAYLVLGRLYARLERYRDALNSYSSLAQLDASSAEAYYQSGLLHLQLNDIPSALRQYNALRSINPELAERLYIVIQSKRR